MSDLTEITQTAQDAITEEVGSKEVGGVHPEWHKQVAFTTLIMALLAALGGMLAGISVHQAFVERTKEIIEMSSLEGDRLYVETLKTKHEILVVLGETPDPAEIESMVAFEKELRELEAGAARDEALAATTGNAHVIFAIAVTLLSVGITLGGMAVVVERKWLWFAGLVVGTAGVLGVGVGIALMLS